MRPVVLIVTTSLDGFLADTSDGVDWLLSPPDEAVPAEYGERVAAIGCLIMGRATYEVSLALPGGTDIFAGKEVYVFTSRSDLPTWPGVTFVHEDPVAFTASLAAGEGSSIWLFGGGKLTTALADADLIDEYDIVVQPILLGDGIPLWVAPHERTKLELIDAKPWTESLAELRYRRANPSV
jgi:dihydrofolate reductase